MNTKALAVVGGFLLCVVGCSNAEPQDPALAAAQRACDRFTKADLWTLEEVLKPNGDYEATVAMTVPGADEVVAAIVRDVSIARRDARFRRLGDATDTLKFLLHGDRTEVVDGDAAMEAACKPLSRM